MKRAAMTALLFETRGILLSLGESAGAELSATISIELAMFPQKTIYLPSGRILDKARWKMNITEKTGTPAAGPGPMGSVSTEEDKDADHCLIAISHGSARFGQLRELFKGGYASEITVRVSGLTENKDFSYSWNTGLTPSLTVESITFDFPLPQSEA